MTNGEDNAQPLLSILIPVYNGAKYLEHLLGLFEEAYRRNPERFDSVEIVVGNNVSEDRTQEIAEAFKSKLPILRVLSLTPHLPTAEENIFRYYESCRGTFTWALGVDDIPNFECFGRVIEWLEKGEGDFYLFNAAIVSEKMSLRRSSNFFMKERSFPINIVDLAQRLGFWFVIAGISGQILRTECVRGYNLLGLIEKTSKIYAHVTAYLEIFRNKKTVVINEPLIFYRVKVDMPHWERVAKTLGVFDEFFWTLGYISQLEYLEERGIIAPDYLSYMLETSEFNFFRPVFVIADKLTRQLEIMSRSHDKRNHVTPVQWTHIHEFLMRKEPFLREWLWVARGVFDTLSGNRKVSLDKWKQLHELLNACRHNSIFAPLLAGTYLEYEIFRVAHRYYAVRHNHDLLLERLRFLDDEDREPDIFTGSNVDEVRSKIEKYEPQSRQGNNDYMRLIEQANHRTATANRALMETRHDYDVLRHSTSWKLTWPLRRAGMVLKRLLRAA
jgi:glycosyltransferase involved in cell wall biosynthesis